MKTNHMNSISTRNIVRNATRYGNKHGIDIKDAIDKFIEHHNLPQEQIDELNEMKCPLHDIIEWADGETPIGNIIEKFLVTWEYTTPSRVGYQVSINQLMELYGVDDLDDNNGIEAIIQQIINNHPEFDNYDKLAPIVNQLIESELADNTESILPTTPSLEGKLIDDDLFDDIAESIIDIVSGMVGDNDEIATQMIHRMNAPTTPSPEGNLVQQVAKYLGMELKQVDYNSGTITCRASNGLDIEITMDLDGITVYEYDCDYGVDAIHEFPHHIK